MKSIPKFKNLLLLCMVFFAFANSSYTQPTENAKEKFKASRKFATNALSNYKNLFRKIDYKNRKNAPVDEKLNSLQKSYKELFYPLELIDITIVKDFESSTPQPDIDAESYFENLVIKQFFESIKFDFKNPEKVATTGNVLNSIQLKERYSVVKARNAMTKYIEDSQILCVPSIIRKKVTGTTQSKFTVDNTLYYYIWWGIYLNGKNVDEGKSGIIGISLCYPEEVDTDGDGIVDRDDRCKHAAGSEENHGCPPNGFDPDEDEVKKRKDKCPYDEGTKDNNGCPTTNPNGDIENTDTTDTDGDGVLDKDDDCPKDPNKTKPGACGCGNPDTDSDNDKTPDCNDKCPQDSTKTEPGPCGCGVLDTDSDKDGTPDCTDECDTLAGPENNKGCPPTPEEELAKAALDKEGRAKVESFLKITNSVASKNSNPTVELTAWNALFDPKQSVHRIGISSYQRKNRVDTVLATNYLDHLYNLNYDRVNMEPIRSEVLEQVDKVDNGVYRGRIRFLQIFDGFGAIGSYCDATEKEVIVWLYKVGDKFEAYLGDIMPINGQTKFRNCKE